VRATDGRLLGRPLVEDFESPYLLSGLARCAPCGGALVGLTRAHGRGRRPLYGCAYHHKRGAAVCANDVEIRQERLETAFLDALRKVLDARMIEEAVREALPRLRQDCEGRLDRRAMLARERSLVEARVRHLVEVVKRGLATDALLRELEAEEARKGVLAAELAQLADLERVATLDGPQVARELAGLAAKVQALLGGAPGRPDRCSASSSPATGSRACRSRTPTAPAGTTSRRREPTRLC
jgi:site-specific DNA recombinase